MKEKTHREGLEVAMRRARFHAERLEEENADMRRLLEKIASEYGKLEFAYSDDPGECSVCAPMDQLRHVIDRALVGRPCGHTGTFPIEASPGLPEETPGKATIKFPQGEGSHSYVFARGFTIVNRDGALKVDFVHDGDGPAARLRWSPLLPDRGTREVTLPAEVFRALVATVVKVSEDGVKLS
jgi:hypothetical protein